MKRLLREPLLHFLIAGSSIFAAYAWLNPAGRGAAPAGSREVRISAGDLRWLSEAFSRQWQRPPTRAEMRGLVTDLLREELLAREAREIGLDENDTIVRRRLAQKMSFLIEDTARLTDPTEDDLRRFYAAHPDLFQEPGRISFTQVYFGPEHRANAAADARAALARLAPSTPAAVAAQLGDRLMLESEFDHADESGVTAQFGADFSRAVFALEPGAWHGPIASGYGFHLVRVSAVRPARTLEFAEVRQRVMERWRDRQQQVADARYFAGLIKKYDIVADTSIRALIGPLDSTLAGPLGGSLPSLAGAAAGSGEVR
jgi:hypothetical protein